MILFEFILRNILYLQNEITAILGHNGAGKTTLMNIIDGTCVPSAGNVCINGQFIKTRSDVIKAMLGICPQHNVLFNELTTMEHLYFYSKLKSKQTNQVDYFHFLLLELVRNDYFFFLNFLQNFR